MKQVLIDFDGVLHSYVSGWMGKREIPDPPNPGAIEWLRELINDPDLEPVIFTTRVNDLGKNTADSLEAKQTIRNWLIVNGLSRDEAGSIRVTCVKEPAVLQIDDRGFQFRGYFPALDYIKTFRPWKQGDDR